MSEPVVGGVVTHVCELASHQVVDGHDVAVACPPAIADDVKATGATWHRWDAEGNPHTVWGEVRQLRGLISDYKPQIVHLHSSKAGFAGRLAVRKSIPTMFTPNGWSFAVGGLIGRCARAWERLALRWTDALIAASAAEALAGARAGVTCSHVVHNGVATPAQIDRAEARRALGLPSRSPLVVCIGRLCKQKGQKDLAALWPTIQAEVPGAELVLLGDGPDRRQLERMATPGVTLAGHRDDVPRWIAASSLVAQPSRWEGFSYAVLEGLAAARAVVAYDAIGMREAIGDAGVVVPIGDVEQLRAAIVRCLTDQRQTDESGVRGRRRVLENFSLERQCRLTTSLALSLASKKHDGT